MIFKDFFVENCFVLHIFGHIYKNRYYKLMKVFKKTIFKDFFVDNCFVLLTFGHIYKMAEFI